MNPISSRSAQRPFAWLLPAVVSAGRKVGLPRFVVSLALMAFVATIASAPWLVTTARTSYELKDKRFVERTVFAPLLNPPKNEERAATHTARLRFDVLALEWVAIAAVSSATLFLFRKTSP